MTTEVEKVPFSQRINVRMIVFAAVVLFLVGVPIYWYVDSEITGGKKKVGDYFSVDLKALGNFPFNGVDGTIDEVPQKWRELDGQRVELQGFVWAPNEAGDRMTRFELVYNIAKCCFGGPPKVQERVFVKVPGDATVPNLTNSYARVIGTLHVKPTSDGGQVSELYTLSLDKIEPLGAS
jgi:hypothetical protein